LGHSDGFPLDGVIHRPAQTVAFCKGFIGHWGPLFALVM
jgi:hypothetical protein